MALSLIEQKGDGVTERFSGGPMPQRTYVPGPHPPAEVEVRELTERQVVPLTEAALYRVSPKHGITPGLLAGAGICRPYVALSSMEPRRHYRSNLQDSGRDEVEADADPRRRLQDMYPRAMVDLFPRRGIAEGSLSSKARSA